MLQDSVPRVLQTQRGLVVERITAPFQPQKKFKKKKNKKQMNPAPMPAQPAIPIPHSIPLSLAPGACPVLLQLVSTGLARGGVQLFRGPWSAGCKPNGFTSRWRICASWLEAEAPTGVRSAIRGRRPWPLQCLASRRDGSVSKNIGCSAASAQAEAPIDLEWLAAGPARMRGAAGPSSADGTVPLLQLVAELGWPLYQLHPPHGSPLGRRPWALAGPGA